MKNAEADTSDAPIISLVNCGQFEVSDNHFVGDRTLLSVRNSAAVDARRNVQYCSNEELLAQRHGVRGRAGGLSPRPVMIGAGTPFAYPAPSLTIDLRDAYEVELVNFLRWPSTIASLRARSAA